VSSAIDWILELLLGASAADRTRGAEEAADAAQHLNDSQALALAGSLVALWANEQEDGVREAQLNALTELVNSAVIPADILAPVLTRRSRAVGSEVEYIGEIEDVTRLRDQ
jgi:hypothetical protein